MDWGALKDIRTTTPGLCLILLTILILAGKLPVDKLPIDYVIGAIFGGGGIALLGANSNKSATLPVIQAPPAPSTSPAAPAPPTTPAA